MNSDTLSQTHRSDNSLQNTTDQMSKILAKNEPENNIQNDNYANTFVNNLNLRKNRIHPQDPRLHLQSNHVSSTPEKVVWGRIFPESSSPKLSVKSENQLKEEEDDDMSKMMMILRWGPQSTPHESSNTLPQPVSPVPSVKKEEALGESENPQSLTLIEQREEYMKKAATLQTKIKILNQRRQELKGDGQRSPSPETKLLLKDNTKLQLVHQNKLKKVNNLIKMLNGMIGERAQEMQMTVKAEENQDVKIYRASAPKRFNYVFYDSELHWCRVCNIFPATATDYLSHLHSQDHKTKVAAGYLEAPWHASAADDSFPTHPNAHSKRMPIKGLQFFVPSTAWYCKLCDQFIGDLHCASAHLKSVTHSKNYSDFVKENPHWESDWMLDRQKAFEDMRLTISLEAVDSFNIESICEKEDENVLSSVSSSESDTPTIFKAKVKPPKTKDPECEPIRKKSLKRLEPLITDRKLLDEINSTKIRKCVSPPHAYSDRSEERRGEAGHDRSWRHDDRTLRHDDRSLGHDGRSLRSNERYDDRRNDDRCLRYDERHSMRYDRERHNDKAHHDRNWARDSGRSRPLSSERRRERERSEVRSLRERSGRERSEFRRGRERSEIRSGRERIEEERSQNGYVSPISLLSSPDRSLSEKHGQPSGKIAPFKIKNPKKYETDVSDEKKTKEDLDAEVQRKVEEFKKHLIRIQAEIQQKKSEENTPHPTTPAPMTMNAAATVDHVPMPAVPPNIPLPGFTLPPMPNTEGLDMNQVVKMASQILQQQAMLGAPFGMDPMCMPQMPMEGSLLGPAPRLPMMPPSLMRMPFMPFMGHKMPLLQTQNNRRRKPYETPSSRNNGAKKNKELEVSEPIQPPGEDKSIEEDNSN